MAQPQASSKDLGALLTQLLATRSFSEAEPPIRQARDIYEKSFGAKHDIVAPRIDNRPSFLGDEAPCRRRAADEQYAPELPCLRSQRMA